jgi:uncharacterized membrane protein
VSSAGSGRGRRDVNVNRVVAAARDTVRSQLWPLPVLGVIIAAAAGVTLPMLDNRIDDAVPSWLSNLLFGGDAGAARTLLDAIASSLITVTSLTFSLTVVTLQLASSQFSPRLLRTFTSDIFVQGTLALFLSTFTYALTVLRAVRSGDASAAFVPRIAVTVAFALAITSVLGLVLFLAHLARQIRVETMLREVHDGASATIRVATGALEDGHPDPVLPVPPPDARALLAPASGFLTGLDESELCSVAADADACLVIDCYPGVSLIEGVPIGVAWSRHGQLDDDTFRTLHRAVQGATTISYERTAAQDVGYGLRQLTDVANKALSPGINDPTTAVHALSHISALLCQLARRDLGARLLRDPDDHFRVVLHRPDLARLLDLSITQPRRYGASDPQVMTRLFQLLEDLAYHTEDNAPIRAQLDRLAAAVMRSDFDDTELAQLSEAQQRVMDVIERAAGGRRGSVDETN